MSKKNTNLFPLLFPLTVILVFTGLAMLYSASTVESYNNFGNTNYYFFHQLLYGGVGGLVLSLVAYRIPMEWWRKLAPIGIVGCIILLALLFVPSLSFKSGGAVRWLQFKSILLQPVEFTKLALVAYLASWFSGRSGKEKLGLKAILPVLLIMLVLSALVIAQPDVGSLLVHTHFSHSARFVNPSEVASQTQRDTRHPAEGWRDPKLLLTRPDRVRRPHRE
jgi:cell division protein FtsW